MPNKKDEKKERGERHFICFSLHKTLKRNNERVIREYMYFLLLEKKAVIFKDIKAECKSNLLKKRD